jgi:release factor glutamine methyltransferase
MNAGELLLAATEALTANGVGGPRREARLLLSAATALPLARLVGWPDLTLTKDDATRFEGLLGRRLAGEPLSRIVGRREFWSLDIELDPTVLDPRPDSETLVTEALARLVDRMRPWRILDLGTGSGCLLLALLSELPNASGIGIDLAPGAARCAAANAARLGMAHRAGFAVMDWSAALRGRFDLVVSNPPYIPRPQIQELEPGVRDFDPQGALDGGEDGLDAYRALALALPGLLTIDGLAVIELGFGQAPAVSELMQANGLAGDGIARDLAGIERALVCRLARVEAAPAKITVGNRTEGV